MDNFAGERPEVSVVIPVSGDTRELRQMLTNVWKWSASTEVIVVCPVRAHITVPRDLASRVRLIEHTTICSYDEGRAVGAFHARGNLILFADERAVLTPLLMQKYVEALQNGADVAVTVSPPSAAPKRKLAAPQSAYHLLNHLLGHARLAAGTMSRIPYACTRQALTVLGHEVLSTPPIAYVKATWEKFKVAEVTPLPAIQWAQSPRSSLSKSTRQILREHAHAIELLMQLIGKRGGLPDGERYRDLLLVPGQLHLRSVFFQPPSEGTGGKRGGKRKKKQARVRKKR